MKPNSNEYFDMPVLLKHNSLNIRQHANNNMISVNEYFDQLSYLLWLVPEVRFALKKFVDRTADIEAYRSIDTVVNLLKGISCDMYVSDLYTILGAYGGNWRLAAHQANGILDGFTDFCSQIEGAKRKKTPEHFPDGISLGEYITLLDEEEAGRKMIILAVDDSPAILNSISSVLHNEYKVLTLPKSSELERVLRKLTPELFLLDYLMPDMNGFELIPIIRSFSEHKDTPIIFLTSAGTIDNITAALALGASDFIVKPFDPGILREKIAKHIKRKKRF